MNEEGSKQGKASFADDKSFAARALQTLYHRTSILKFHDCRLPSGSKLWNNCWCNIKFSASKSRKVFNIQGKLSVINSKDLGMLFSKLTELKGQKVHFTAIVGIALVY